MDNNRPCYSFHHFVLCSSDCLVLDKDTIFGELMGKKASFIDVSNYTRTRTMTSYVIHLPKTFSFIILLIMTHCLYGPPTKLPGINRKIM